MTARLAALGPVALCMLAACGTVTVSPQGAPVAPQTAVNPARTAVNASQTFTGFVACRETIVEGAVVAQQRSGGKRLLLTLEVTRWFTPASGPARVTLNVKDPVAENPAAGIPFETGVHYLIAVPKSEAGHDHLTSKFSGDRLGTTRDKVIASLRELEARPGGPECRAGRPISITVQQPT